MVFMLARIGMTCTPNTLCFAWYCASAGRQDDDADDKSSRRAKAGKGRGGDDTENAKKLVQDLVDAFSGFGVSQSLCLQ